MKHFGDLTQQCLNSLVPSDAFGIYIHVPFCERRCKYCAFVSSIWRPVPSEAYGRALCCEMDAFFPAYLPHQLATVYWGGGTPSMLDDHTIAEVMAHIHKRCGQALETTLEANPEHVTLQRAKIWKSLGFSRVSLGVQSFDDAMLTKLGRRHDKRRVTEAIQALRVAGFEEICIDLIYGARRSDGKSRDEIEGWRQELETARDIGPSHISCYELTLEAHTPLCTAQERHHDVVCEDDLIAEMMGMIPDVLQMERYEISNYSRDGYFSAHNVSCWAGLPYLGLGPGAHTLALTPTITRRANIGHVRRWLTQMTEHGYAEPDFTEHLSPHEHLAERLMCAARTRFWWQPNVIAQQIHADITPYLPALTKAVKLGLIEQNPEGHYRTTDLGISLNNRLDSLLFDPL